MPVNKHRQIQPAVSEFMMPAPVIDPLESHPKVCREHVRRIPIAEITRHGNLARRIWDQVSG